MYKEILKDIENDLSCACLSLTFLELSGDVPAI